MLVIETNGLWPMISVTAQGKLYEVANPPSLMVALTWFISSIYESHGGSALHLGSRPQQKRLFITSRSDQWPVETNRAFLQLTRYTLAALVAAYGPVACSGIWTTDREN
ncbi:hypothetical protein PoB_005499200 [Plakobranchus ocellatus]|uniref:Uncharacterized protein n=1 Tax=Plakobranchus ocellatus TaxID=259542 RepID=A0AAV4CB52_9GAST|nr:hypothetical protein PoB_005499200 [Plakobranchus ocellatus]